jgi:hypothetical protein
VAAVAGKDVWQVEHAEWGNGAACSEARAGSAMDRAGASLSFCES